MSFKEYTDFDATGLAKLLRQGEVSPAELVMATFERFQRHNPALKNRGGRAVLGSRLERIPPLGQAAVGGFRVK